MPHELSAVVCYFVNVEAEFLTIFVLFIGGMLLAFNEEELLLGLIDNRSMILVQ